MNNAAESGNQATNQKSRPRVNNNGSYRLTSKSEISNLLGKLSSNHTLLSIAIEGSSKIFGSMILEVNNDKSYLVLDELYPRNEISESLVDKKLIIETHLDGIEIRFTVKVSAVAAKDEIEYYRVSYPAYVFHHQRRDSFRVNIGLSEVVELALSTSSQVLLHAELRDISLGGVSARINSPVSENLSVGDEIPTCVIHTPDGKKIVSSLEIARVEDIKATHSVRIGARFTHISASDKQELSRLIAKQDRENIKKLKRLPGDG